MKKLPQQFISHLRSYRTFNFMFFTFLLLITSLVIYSFSNRIYAEDLLEKAFEPAMSNETVVNLWAGKNAVGNEVLRQWVGVQEDLWFGCFVNGQKIDGTELKTEICESKYNWTFVPLGWSRQGLEVYVDECHLPAWGTQVIQDVEKKPFCQDVLWGSRKVPLITTEAPLIVRIAKFLLRITMVLAVTMVIYNGIMWIIESSRWAEIKDAKKNITLIVVGILIALMSLWIINLISSLTVSSLGGTPQ